MKIEKNICKKCINQLNDVCMLKGFNAEELKRMKICGGFHYWNIGSEYK